MAVQQNKKSPSRRGHRRSHGALAAAELSTDSLTGELHRRHHLTKDGYYRGRKILAAVVNPVPEKKVVKRKPKTDKVAKVKDKGATPPEAVSATVAAAAAASSPVAPSVVDKPADSPADNVAPVVADVVGVDNAADAKDESEAKTAAGS